MWRPHLGSHNQCLKKALQFSHNIAYSQSTTCMYMYSSIVTLREITFNCFEYIFDISSFSPASLLPTIGTESVNGLMEIPSKMKMQECAKFWGVDHR